jgi:hypothetical protein
MSRGMPAKPDGVFAYGLKPATNRNHGGPATQWQPVEFERVVVDSEGLPCDKCSWSLVSPGRYRLLYPGAKCELGHGKKTILDT